MSLEVAALDAGYGRIRVCRGISFSARDGECLAIVGANGAGKSTLLGALAGTVEASGSIHIGTSRLHTRKARQRARMGVALVPEGRRNLFFPLTVAENLQLGLRLLPGAERPGMLALLLDTYPILGARRAQTAGTLSGGEQQLLAIAVAVARRPSVLLLDEPSQGLAPRVLEELTAKIGALRRLDLAVVLAEQNHRFAALLADRYLLLHEGEIAGEGSAQQLADRERATAGLGAPQK